MNRYWLSALIVPAVFSANAFAHDWDDEDHHGHRHHRWAERVVVQQAYVQPEVIYQLPPQTVYRERVVYRPAVYYETAPVYQEPPRYYSQPQPYPVYNRDRAVGQALGAVAGAVIGNQFGHGDGRVLSTAAGAVIGGVVGGNLSGY